MPAALNRRSSDNRAVAFIDGANLYNWLKTIGIRANEIDPYKVAQKLAQDRPLREVRYYIARIDNTAPERVYQANRAIIALMSSHKNSVVRTGHIQYLRDRNRCAEELRRYLATLTVRLPAHVYKDLTGIAARYSETVLHREKGVDVYLACDLVDLARRDAFDLAYLISGDADFGPAVRLARSFGKRVYAASPDVAKRLRDECDLTIRLRHDWFADCLKDS